MEQSGIKLGVYEHYTGNKYEVIGVAKRKDKDTKEEFVVLRALFNGYDMWVRPLDTFHDEVEVNGNKVPRYKYVGD
jgi:hypothetical protein